MPTSPPYPNTGNEQLNTFYGILYWDPGSSRWKLDGFMGGITPSIDPSWSTVISFDVSSDGNTLTKTLGGSGITTLRKVGG